MLRRFSVSCHARMLMAGLIGGTSHFGDAGEFIAGADASHARFFEDRGKVCKEGTEVRDIFEILQHKGLTCVRLRLFTSSESQAQMAPYNSINNLDYTIPLAVRVK